MIHIFDTTLPAEQRTITRQMEHTAELIVETNDFVTFTIQKARYRGFGETIQHAELQMLISLERPGRMINTYPNILKIDTAVVDIHWSMPLAEGPQLI